MVGDGIHAGVPAGLEDNLVPGRRPALAGRRRPARRCRPGFATHLRFSRTHGSGFRLVWLRAGDDFKKFLGRDAAGFRSELQALQRPVTKEEGAEFGRDFRDFFRRVIAAQNAEDNQEPTLTTEDHIVPVESLLDEMGADIIDLGTQMFPVRAGALLHLLEIEELKLTHLDLRAARERQFEFHFEFGLHRVPAPPS